jgi:uncharacterized protein YggT (Ycf19 family)
VRLVQPVQPIVPAQPIQPVQPVQLVAPVSATDAAVYRVQRIRQILYTVVGILDIILLVRLALRLLGANPDAPFSSLVYSLTSPFVAPFEGVFPDTQSRGSVLEVSTVLAILTYPLLAWIVVQFVKLTNRRAPTPTA